jgi:hypothetical protein
LNPKQQRVEITVAAAVPRGTYQLTLTGPGGTSNELAIYVDDLPQLVEAEPNNAAPQAAMLKLPVQTWGVISAAGDMDHYAFDGRRGETVVVELAAKRLTSTLNATLILLNPAGEVVANNNDFDGQNDPLIAYTLPADGRYTVRVHDLIMAGAPTSYYRLTIGMFPYVSGVYPLSVSAGRESTLTLCGWNLPAGASVKVNPAKAGEVAVNLDPHAYRTGRVMRVLASDDQELLEREPNDTPAQATQLPAVPTTGALQVAGRIWAERKGQANDVDLFRFEAKQGEELILETTAARRGSPVDTKLEVLNNDGQLVERLRFQAVRDSYLSFRPVNSTNAGFRAHNWEEMELNQWLYISGEVNKIFRLPRGPDSDITMYTIDNRRRPYFDTNATAHALDEPVYVVEPHPAGTKLPPNGLPTFPLFYSNDDAAERGYAGDSRLAFTAPTDGRYLVRVSDVRGFGGDRFVYRLTLRHTKPDFQVKLVNPRPKLSATSGTPLTFRANRMDGFDGDIRLELDEPPAGFSLPRTLVIEAGHDEAKCPIVAASPAAKWPKDAKVAIRAIAQIGDERVTHEVDSLTMVEMKAAPSVRVFLEPAELTIQPGSQVVARLRVERNGFTERISFDVENLPHGVIVDNIGLNGILIPAGQSERQLFLRAAPWVAEMDRPCFAMTTAGRSKDGPEQQASAMLLLHVRQPSNLAQGAAPQPPATAVAPKN